jgi:hypothetical protein
MMTRPAGRADDLDDRVLMSTSPPPRQPLSAGRREGAVMAEAAEIGKWQCAGAAAPRRTTSAVESGRS